MPLLKNIQQRVDRIVHHSHSKSTDALRLNHYIWLTLICIPLSISFIIKNTLENHYDIALTVTILLVCMLISLSVISKIKNFTLLYHLNNGVFMLMLTLVSVWGDKSEGQILWCYIYPLLSIFLFGNRIGIFWSLLLLFSVMGSLGLIGHINFNEPIDFEIRFSVIYLTILFMTSWLEYYRGRYTHQAISQQNALKKEREILNKEISRRIKLEAELEELVHQDDLTEMYNRRYFLSRLNQELVRAKRYGIPVSLAIIDMDKFKRINDTYGHLAGDSVLKSFAKHCEQSLRTSDIAGRVGGEEFAILLPCTAIAQAQQVMERFRQEVSELLCDFHGIKIQVTISIGLSVADNEHADPDLLYSDADRALYQAKKAGRNKVVIKNN